MVERMLAARFHAAHQPLALEEVPRPRPGQGQVVVEVRACGLCGSDLHILKGETFPGQAPLILGHEAAGVVAEVGPGAGEWRVGQRVAVNCVQSCGLCPNCQRGRDSICLQRRLIGIHLDGALAPYVAVTARSLVALPETVGFAQGAVVTDAAATPYHALKARAGLRGGESVAIFGAGGLGAHAVKLARLLGAAPIIVVDVNPPALERALRFGADLAVNARSDDPAAAIGAYTGGRGVEVALECVGSARVVGWALRSVAVGGRVAVVGLSPERLDLGEITPWVRSEVTLLASSAFETKEIQELVNLVAGGRLDLSESVTATLPLAQVNEGLARLQQNQGEILRLVVDSF